MRRPILNNSSPGQTIYEPFVGSGTTIIAAETACLAMGLNPAYVDVALQRWEAFTGEHAVLDGDGHSFNEIAAARATQAAA
jgi:DNA modification methylase